MPTVTRIFNHKRYSLFRSFPTKREAHQQAKIIRSESRLARVTEESVQYHGSAPTTRYAVWVK